MHTYMHTYIEQIYSIPFIIYKYTYIKQIYTVPFIIVEALEGFPELLFARKDGLNFLVTDHAHLHISNICLTIVLSIV
jgi:hypothetical protein